MEYSNVQKVISSTTGHPRVVVVARKYQRAEGRLPLRRASIPSGVLQTPSTHTSVKFHIEIINRGMPLEGTERNHSLPGIQKLSLGNCAARLVPH
jgi:hypothetical protein